MRKTKYAVYLTEAERAQLRTLIGSGEAPARLLTHARILLKANQGEGGPGWSDAAIAGALDLHPDTVARVRRAYVGAGLEAALARKAPHPGCIGARSMARPRRIWLPSLAHPRPRDVSAGRCGCWPMSWCASRWWRP